MANKIILKKSSVVAKVPLTTDLDYGELAINYADGKLYYKKSDNTIDEFISASATSGVTSVDGNTGAVTSAQLLTAIKKEDGSGSGLDADLLDGQNGTYYAAASSLSNYLPLSGGTLTGTLNLAANGLVAGTDQLVITGGNVGIGTASPSKLINISSLTNTSKLAAEIISNSGSAQTYVLRLNRTRDDAYGTTGDNANNPGHTILRIDSTTSLNYAHAQELITAYKGASKVFSVRHDGYLNSLSAKIDNRLTVKDTYADDGNSGTDHLLWVSQSQDRLLGLRNQLLWSSYGANIIELGSAEAGTAFGIFNFRFKSNVTSGTLSLLGNNIGNLGVGTTSPRSKLGVNGSGNFGSDKTAGSSPLTIGLVGGFSDTRSIGYLYNGLSNREIGSQINFIGSGNSNGYQGGYITFFTSNAGDTTLTEKVRIDTSGNVGIATTSPTSKLHVAGTLKHSGLDFTEGSNVDQITTITKSITLTTDWQDTGIKSTDLTTGSYIIQLYANDTGSGGTNSNEYYSGTMSWYAGDTNSSVELPTDEIVLHRAGGSGDGALYLRTYRTATADPDNLKLQIYSNTANASAANYVFKFRRVI